MSHSIILSLRQQRLTRETIEGKKKERKKKIRKRARDGRDLVLCRSWSRSEKEKFAKGNHGRRIELSSVIKRTGRSMWRIIARNGKKNSFAGARIPDTGTPGSSRGCLMIFERYLELFKRDPFAIKRNYIGLVPRVEINFNKINGSTGNRSNSVPTRISSHRAVLSQGCTENWFNLRVAHRPALVISFYLNLFLILASQRAFNIQRVFSVLF